MKKKYRIWRRRVNSDRNSICGSCYLQDLDWQNWYTDTGWDQLYLHVKRRISEDYHDETWHRVYCRYTNKPRLSLRDGVLYWIIDINT